MPLVKDPPDFARPTAPPELRARLAEATATTAALLPLVNRLAAVYREVAEYGDHALAKVAEDEFTAAEQRFVETSGMGALGAALSELWNPIAAALIGSPR